MNSSHFAAVVLILVFCAGCEQGTQLVDKPNTARAADSSYLAGVSEFHWATSESFERIAMKFRFQLPDQETHCTYTHAKCFQLNDFGLSDWNVITGDSIQAWGGFSVTKGGPYVVAGPIDTRFDLELDEHWCVVNSTTTNVYLGRLTHYLFATDIKARDLGAGRAVGLAVSLECDAAFDVLGADIGSEADLYDWDTLNLTSANLDPAGNILVGNGASLLESPEAGYFTGHSGEIEFAVLTVNAPDGDHTSPQIDAAGLSIGWLEHVEAGPGEYQFNVVRSSLADMGSWWLLTYGLERPMDIGPGLLSESAIGSP